MEGVRYKKSNSRLNTGEKQNQKQRSIPKISSNTSSSITARAAEDSITFNSVRSSLKFVSGTPIKKLLAEEMAKENESKRRQPGLIARLMGLDGLPPQNPLPRQDKHFLGTHKRSASMDLEMKTKPHMRQSSRRTTSLGEQEFRDVYEIPETIKFEKHGYPSRKIVHPREEMVQCSKNLPRNDQFTKIHRQPGLLFHGHLHCMQDATPSAQCTCIADTKPKKSAIRKSNNIGCKSERKGLSVDAKYRRQQYDSSITLSENNVHGAKEWLKPSKTRLESLHETDTLPTKIVVLKPNLEKMKATNKSVSSPASFHGSFSKSRSEDSREIAKTITRRVRKCFHRDPVEFSSILIGYAGDESSYNVSDSDSASESEVTMLTSRQMPLSSRRVQSSVNREVKKKRLTESQNRKGVEVFGEGNTLNEMLDIPNRDTKALFSDTSSYRDDGEWSSHLGINSMDGWKDVNIQSRSKEMKKWKLQRREDSSSRNLRFNSKKFQTSQRIFNSSSDSLDLEYFHEPQMVMDEEGNLSETRSSLAASKFIPGLDEEGVLMDMIESSESPSDEFPPKTSTGLESSYSSTFDRQTSKAQGLQEDQLEEDSIISSCPIPEPPQSPGSSKEADQPSPVSILEAPFTEDLPVSPNCFESVNAGLQELKMQLKLLKMECAEEDIDSTVISKDDENLLPSSYLADVLTDFCISPMGYSPDCPLSNCLFEKLENKYCDNTTWPRWERMLLFDRINICLFDMLQALEDDHYDDPYSPRKVMEVKQKVEEELENEEKRIKEEITERMVDREMQWPGLRESMDFIGKELEKLLLNDLIENAAFQM